MTYIQQTMDIAPNIHSRTLSFSQKPSRIPSAISRTSGSISVSAFCYQLSKHNINLGRNQMFRWLRKNGYISKQKSTWNMPLQKYINQDLFSVKETFVLVADEQVPKYSPLITQKGSKYLIEHLQEDISVKQEMN